MNSKFGNLTRRCPEFEPGESGAEAAQLEQVERCRRVSNSAAIDEVKNQLLSSFMSIDGWIIKVEVDKSQ
jgi:hypothetical protein